MKTFGELLREYIEKSGFTIYQFANISGVNRVNIQRYLADQRFPSPDIYEILRSHLQLRPSEQQKLETSYEMSRIGKTRYLQRAAVKRLIESATLIYESERQMPACFGKSPDSVLHVAPHCPNGVCAVSGSLNACHLFQAELTRTVLSHEDPHAGLFLPAKPEHNLLNTSLTILAPHQDHPIQITQIFPMAKAQADFDGHNLDVIAAVLPLCFSARFRYQAFFYYDDCLSDKNYGLLYPYYAIFPDSLLLFSQDMENALLCQDKTMVGLYQTQFDHHLRHCSKIIDPVRPFSGPAHILSYYPCLTALNEPEKADLLLWEDMEKQEIFPHAASGQFPDWQDPDEWHCHYFAEQGLMEFAKTGVLMELPPSLTQPLPPRHRLIFLNRLREICSEAHTFLYLINSDAFRVPPCLNLIVTERNASLFHLIGCPDERAVSIRETGICLALADFLVSLPDSPYIYTKSQSLEIINRAIRQIT